MRYISTRGQAPALDFKDVLLAGLARDGGLYVPEHYPQLTKNLSGYSYQAIAFEVMQRLTGDAFGEKLKPMIEAAYGNFRHPAVTPLVQTNTNEWVLELFHGPTLAFKDLAMQLLARMMESVLSERNQRATIIGATSGDTGGAAIEAFKGLSNVDIYILFPKGRVSDVQRRMMTTVHAANIHAVSVDGTFDDCQAMVKTLFNTPNFREKVGLSGVNSINWARIAAQVVYYFAAHAALQQPARYIVPTGNFGDIFAGFVAKQMGLPMEKLVIATNQNDILTRTLESGRYEVTGVEASSSPSMDIQVSSNFERLLFESNGRDAAVVQQLMANLTQSNAFTLSPQSLAFMRQDFLAERANEAEVASMMRQVLGESGYQLDTHTGVGMVAARKLKGNAPSVVLSTAHPAKFPDAVKAATGQDAPLPLWLGDLMTRKEEMQHIAASSEEFMQLILKKH